MQEKYYTFQETKTPLAECDIENITKTCLKIMLTAECLCLGFFFYWQSKNFGQEDEVHKELCRWLSSAQLQLTEQVQIRSEDALAVRFREVEG